MVVVITIDMSINILIVIMLSLQLLSLILFIYCRNNFHYEYFYDYRHSILVDDVLALPFLLLFCIFTSIFFICMIIIIFIISFYVRPFIKECERNERNSQIPFSSDQTRSIVIVINIKVYGHVLIHVRKIACLDCYP